MSRKPKESFYENGFIGILQRTYYANELYASNKPQGTGHRLRELLHWVDINHSDEDGAGSASTSLMSMRQ